MSSTTTTIQTLTVQHIHHTLASWFTWSTHYAQHHPFIIITLAFVLGILIEPLFVAWEKYYKSTRWLQEYLDWVTPSSYKKYKQAKEEKVQFQQQQQQQQQAQEPHQEIFSNTTTNNNQKENANAHDTKRQPRRRRKRTKTKKKD